MSQWRRFGQLDGVLLDHGSPDAGAQRAAREILDQGRERRVAGRRDDDPVEFRVGGDEGLRRLGRVHRREAALERCEILVVEARRRHLRRDGLEDPAHLVEFQEGRARQEVGDEPHAREQQLRLEAGHVGAIAHARLEYPDQRECAHGLAQRVAREAQSLGEVLLVGQLRAGGELAGHDQVLDLRDRLIGECSHAVASAVAAASRPYSLIALRESSCSAWEGSRCSITRTVSRQTRS